jgi:hypothetical protein
MQHTCQHVESLHFLHTARETSTIVNCHLSRPRWKHPVILFLMVRLVYIVMQRLSFNKLFFFFLLEFHARHSIKMLMLFNFFIQSGLNFFYWYFWVNHYYFFISIFYYLYYGINNPILCFSFFRNADLIQVKFLTLKNNWAGMQRNMCRSFG